MGQALVHEFAAWIAKMLGWDVARFADIQAITLKAAISGSILQGRRPALCTRLQFLEHRVKPYAALATG